jgi:hypothetical protein
MSIVRAFLFCTLHGFAAASGCAKDKKPASS